MNTQTFPWVPADRLRWSAPALVLASLLATAAFAGEPGAVDESWRAGVAVRAIARASDTGLPSYPGAFERATDGKDSESLKLGVAVGKLGVRLAVLKLYTEDAPADVARFYREALARHGTVLDCSRGEPVPAPAKGSLRCDRDGPVQAGHLFKVGAPGNFRAVAVDRLGALTRIQLVRLRTKGD